MDLVSRLRQFLSANNIPVTQFADKCNIPRPTLSQIVNGRNKKISDEIISKIHEGYPALSVYWLMFGEGNMINPVERNLNEFDDSVEQSKDSTITEHNISQKLIFNSPEVNESKNKGYVSNNERIYSKKNISTRDPQIDNVSDNKRYITKIVVFYNDNSFESFGPNQHELL